MDRPESMTADARSAESLDAMFRRLAAVWRAETGHLSSARKIAAHPAYQQIVALGSAVVPLLLADLERQPDHWFVALERITGANPVPPEDRGDVARMAQDWLRWGREAGYRW